MPEEPARQSLPDPEPSRLRSGPKMERWWPSPRGLKAAKQAVNKVFELTVNAEQIVTLLRQIEVGIANGKTTPQVCKEAEITVQTYYRWRKEYGGLKLDQAKRLKELEKENAKLKRVVAELSLEKQVLKDIAEGNF
jgi:putative transposase